MANIYEPPSLEYQLDEDLPAPTLDMSVLEEIAASHGIDLNQPLTKENAAILNYAFQDNPSFPEGTMVAIYWNEESNSGELSVVCPTVLHRSDDSFPGGYDPEFTTVFNNNDQWGDPNQSYSYQVLNNNQESGNDHVSAIPSYWRADGTVFARNLYADEEGLMDEMGGGELDEQHPYYVVNQRYVYKLNGTGSVRENVEAIDSQMSTDRWYHLDVQGMIDSGDPMYAGMEVSTLSSATQANYGRAPEGGDLFFGYYDTNRNEGFNLDWEGYVPIENGDMVTYDGFAYPAEYITHYEETIAHDLRTKIEAQIGNSDASLSVRYDYKTNRFIVDSDYFGEPMEISADGSLDSGVIVDTALGVVNSRIDSGEYQGYKILELINQGRDSSGKGVLFGQEYDIVYNEETGKYYFVSEDSTVEITPEDLMDPEKSQTIRMLADANILENKFRQDDFDVSIQDTETGEKLYRVVNDGEVKYYKLDSDGTYVETDNKGNVTGETRTSSLEEIVDQNGAVSNNDGYSHNYNSRIARNQSRAISVVDEELYNSIRGNFKGIDFSTVGSNASSGCSKLTKYYPNAGSVSSAVSASSSELMNHMDLLSRLIDGVVNLYIGCDANMKKVLDNILFGGENSLESFADYVFGMKEKVKQGEIYTDETFVAEFHAIYKEYLDKISTKANEIVSMSQGNMVIDAATYGKITPDHPFYEMIETDSNGIHYININKLTDKYGDSVTAMFNCKTAEESCQAFISKSSVNVSADDVKAFIATPLANYFGFAEDYNGYTKFTESYIRMRDIEPFVEDMFTEDYRAKLDEVRRTGKIGNEKLEDTFMSPAEFAMTRHLRTTKREGQYMTSTFKRELNMRDGREQAANLVLEIINGDITWDDYLRQAGIGTVDGLIKIPVGFSHLWNEERTPDEWSQIYVKEFLEGEYDLDEVNRRYKNGELSDKEYELVSRLTGNAAIENSRKISKFEKTLLEGTYDLGYSFGDNLTNLGIDGLCAVLSATGVGAMAVSIIKNGIKAASAAGYARTEQFEERLLHDENAIYPIVTFASTFGTGFVTDALKASIGGESFSMKAGATYGSNSAGVTGGIGGRFGGTFSFKTGAKKLLPVLGWLKEGGSKEFGKAATGFVGDWINDAIINETWNGTNGRVVIGRDGNPVQDNTKSTEDSFTSGFSKMFTGKFDVVKTGKKVIAIFNSSNADELYDNIAGLAVQLGKGGVNYTKFGVGYKAPSPSSE